MQMIKYTHACVRLVDGHRNLVIDPGAWAEDAAFDAMGDVLVTHVHADHIDLERLVARHRTNPELRVFMPAEVAAEAAVQAPSFTAAVEVVSVGETFTAGGFAVRTVGGRHSIVYDGVPDAENIGYVVEDSVYHPGDSTFVPDAAIETLLVPTAGPWLKLAEAIDFVRAVKPARALSIHDTILSERGAALVDRWLTEKGGTDYRRLAPGQSTDF
jgi:L-ascorbate metabolism protein UlaG (beta-lactamase superfamily)